MNRTIRIELCDLCNKPLKGPGVQPELRRHGMAITCGYSIGGWGSRQDYVNFSGEVCDQCFEEFKKFSMVAVTWIERRDGSRMPDITVNVTGVTVETEMETSKKLLL